MSSFGLNSSFGLKLSYDRALARIPDTVARGQTACEALLDEFFVDFALDAANWVFLQIGHPEDVDTAIIERFGSVVSKVVQETLGPHEFGHAVWRIETAHHATQAYYGRLRELFKAFKVGGSA